MLIKTPVKERVASRGDEARRSHETQTSVVSIVYAVRILYFRCRQSLTLVSQIDAFPRPSLLQVYLETEISQCSLRVVFQFRAVHAHRALEHLLDAVRYEFRRLGLIPHRHVSDRPTSLPQDASVLRISLHSVYDHLGRTAIVEYAGIRSAPQGQRGYATQSCGYNELRRLLDIKLSLIKAHCKVLIC